MRVFLEVKSHDNYVEYINIDKIEEIIAYKDGKCTIVLNDDNQIKISEEEFKRWKKFVEVI